MIRRYDQAIGVISPQIRMVLEQIDPPLKERIQEIRLRADSPVVLVTDNGCWLTDGQGKLFRNSSGAPLICSYECLQQTFRAVCGYSVHTHQREMIRGYITVKGGHRVGFGATAVEQNGVITSLKEISSVHIRVARQVFGCADRVVPYAPHGLLIAGCPGSGKTTVLRDLARQLSGKDGVPDKKVVILDERGELAAVWDGIPQNDIGINTDVLNGFSKTSAMGMAVRSLSPDVIVCDEIGSGQEAKGMLMCMNAGVRVVASVHAGNLDELYRKPWVMELLRAGVFTYIAVLDGQKGKGTVERVCETNDWLDEMDGRSADGIYSDIQRNSNGAGL